MRGIALAAEVTKGHLHGLSSSLGFQRALPLGAGSFNDESSPYSYSRNPLPTAESWNEGQSLSHRTCEIVPGGSGVRHLLNGNLATLVITVALAGSATTLSAKLKPQPSGIYDLLVGAPVTGKIDLTDNPLLDNPNIDGFRYRIGWAKIQPDSAAVFKWESIDAAIAIAAAIGVDRIFGWTWSSGLTATPRLVIGSELHCAKTGEDQPMERRASNTVRSSFFMPKHCWAEGRLLARKFHAQDGPPNCVRQFLRKG